MVFLAEVHGVLRAIICIIDERLKGRGVAIYGDGEAALRRG